jgi:hypothetical protein
MTDDPTPLTLACRIAEELRCGDAADYSIEEAAIMALYYEMRRLKRDSARLDWMGAEGTQWDRYDRVLAYWYDTVDFRDAVDGAMRENAP